MVNKINIQSALNLVNVDLGCSMSWSLLWDASHQSTFPCSYPWLMSWPISLLCIHVKYIKGTAWRMLICSSMISVPSICAPPAVLWYTEGHRSARRGLCTYVCRLPSLQTMITNCTGVSNNITLQFGMPTSHMVQAVTALLCTMWLLVSLATEHHAHETTSQVVRPPGLR